MADFATLKLAGCVSGEDGNAGDEIWEITQHGKDVFEVYRITQLEKAMEKKTDEETNS